MFELMKQDHAVKFGHPREINLQIQHLKKGGKVKKGKSVAKATATNTVHIHMAKRGGGARKPPTQRPAPFINVGGGFANEAQLARLFQSLAMAPLKAQGAPVLPQEVQLPEQKHNIINLEDLANNPTIRQLHRDEFKREEWARQAEISHASHLPSSIDHADPAEVRTLPFSRLSYGDEDNVQRRSISSAEEQKHAERNMGYYEDPMNFSYPAEPMRWLPPAVAIAQPMAQPTGNPVPFAGVPFGRIRPLMSNEELSEGGHVRRPNRQGMRYGRAHSQQGYEQSDTDEDTK
jgi:hypothetical protein